MKNILLILLLFISNLSYSQITPLTYQMTSRDIVTTINANKSYFENYIFTEEIVPSLTNSSTYASFITKMNALFDSIQTRMYDRGQMLYQPLHKDSIRNTYILNKINSNFNNLKLSADTFKTDGVVGTVEFKQLWITNKNSYKATILSQKNAWKLCMYNTEDTLWLTDDNGLTWKYKKYFAGATTICMANVFTDGSILIATKTNKLWSSQDRLQTINEVICKEPNGDNMIFHTPQNASYPGSYFQAFSYRSYFQGTKEILLWGTYTTNITYNGASPVNLYYTKDRGITVTVAYHFGYTVWRDNGTSTGSLVTGDQLGDPLKPSGITHVHTVSFNAKDSCFLIQTGEGGTYADIIKGYYDISNDTWSFTPYTLGPYFSRNVGILAYSGGDSIYFVSDNTNGSVFRKSYVNITNGDSTLSKRLGVGIYQRSLIGISDTYQQNMLSTVYGNTTYNGTLLASLVITTDYGRSWHLLPIRYYSTNYYNPGGTVLIRRIYDTDSNGYVLYHCNKDATQYFQSTTDSYLLKVHDKK